MLPLCLILNTCSAHNSHKRQNYPRAVPLGGGGGGGGAIQNCEGEGQVFIIMGRDGLKDKKN